MPYGCVICQEGFDDAGVGIVTTKCGHVFHHNCIDEWLNESHTCPECRSSVTRISLTKLFFNFPVDSDSQTITDQTLNALREKLRANTLECMNKNKQIKELRISRLEALGEVMKARYIELTLRSTISKLETEKESLIGVKAKNRKLLKENKKLESDLELMNNVKEIVEGCSSDAEKILADVVSGEEGKEATRRIAKYCSVIMRELKKSRDQKTELEDQLTQVLGESGIVQATSAREIRLLKEKIIHLEEQISSPIPATPGALSKSSQSNHRVKSASACGPSRDDSSNCEKQVTPITIDFPEKKRRKINVVVRDKKVPKVSAQAPATPVSQRGCFAMPGRSSVRNPKDEESVSRIGYNGLGGHGCFVIGSGKGKLFKKKKIELK